MFEMWFDGGNIVPVNDLIAELGDGGGTKKDGLLFALGGALRAFPNEITVQGGGVPAGDNMTIRGFSGRTDIFVDGIRDFGGYTRGWQHLDGTWQPNDPASFIQPSALLGGQVFEE